MSARAASLAGSGVPQPAALNGGITAAFGVAAVISLAAIVAAFFMHNPKPAAGGHGEPAVDEHRAVVDDVAPTA